jgi:VIT1/CCC1 family predicted Fe2+/Mn2+ transporter
VSDREQDSTDRDDPAEAADRRYNELLQELRVALPGVQVLFAFLLVVPFQQGWETVDGAEKHVYYVALLLTAVSSICFIAPTARHRLRFREGDLRWVVESSNRLMVVGLISLGAAIAAVLLLITMVVFSDGFAIAVCAVFAAGIVWAWFGAPLLREWRHD